jgi:hypothetical protein
MEDKNDPKVLVSGLGPRLDWIGGKLDTAYGLYKEAKRLSSNYDMLLRSETVGKTQLTTMVNGVAISHEFKGSEATKIKQEMASQIVKDIGENLKRLAKIVEELHIG